jgi:drug/metabolite transporter (DMT)-like permease
MMLDDSPPPRWLVLLRWALLGLAILASAATALVLGFATYLFLQGYSGGNNPESVAPVAFPIAFAIYAFVGVPTALVCALAWVGYYAVTRRIRRSSR